MDEMTPATGDVPAFFDAVADEIPARPQPTMRGSLAAVGGLLVAIGLVVVGAEKLTEASKGLPIALALVAVAVGYGALFGLPAHGERRWVTSSAVASITVGATVAGFLAAFDFADPDPTAPFLLATLALVVVYLVPGTRGRPVPLGVALAGLWFLLLDATTDGFGVSVDAGTSVADDGSLVSMLYGLALLGVAFWLDKAGRHGVLATPFVAIGNLAYIIGTFGVIGNVTGGDETGTSLLVVAAGVVLMFIGNTGRDRRFTTWTGAAGVFAGIVSFVASVFDDTDSGTVPGIVLTLIGLALAAGALYWDRLRDANATGATGVVAASPAGEAGWHPDPTGRHEYRYWDGTAWTAHVTTQGAAQVDPFGPA